MWTLTLLLESIFILISSFLFSIYFFIFLFLYSYLSTNVHSQNCRCLDYWLRRWGCVCLTLPGAARLSAPTNKDSETRSNLYIFYIYVCFNSFTNPSPSFRVWIHFYTFPCGEGFKRGLQPELKSLFYMIFYVFEGTGLYLHANAPLKPGDQTMRDELCVFALGIIIIL